MANLKPQLVIEARHENWPLREALSPDGRFAMLADLHEKQAPLPGNGRYTLSSSLGDAALGTCGGSLPDPLFANGFEN